MQGMRRVVPTDVTCKGNSFADEGIVLNNRREMKSGKAGATSHQRNEERQGRGDIPSEEREAVII